MPRSSSCRCCWCRRPRQARRRKESPIGSACFRLARGPLRARSCCAGRPWGGACGRVSPASKLAPWGSGTPKHKARAFASDCPCASRSPTRAARCRSHARRRAIHCARIARAHGVVRLQPRRGRSAPSPRGPARRHLHHYDPRRLRAHPPSPARLALLRLSFLDADRASDTAPEDALFARDHAQQVWSLLLAHRDDPEREVLRCDVGISRSAGVAAAIVPPSRRPSTSTCAKSAPRRGVMACIAF